jgi:hypothetical protein
MFRFTLFIDNLNSVNTKNKKLLMLSLTRVDDVLEGWKPLLDPQRHPLECDDERQYGVSDDIPSHQSGGFILKNIKTDIISIVDSERM